MNLRVLALALGMAAAASPAIAGGPSIDLTSGRGSFVVGLPTTKASADENSFAQRSDSASRQGTAFSQDRIGRGGSDRGSPVAAVPEPETYAMLAAGLCVVVMLSRRRRRD